MRSATKAIRFIESLSIPTGKNAGRALKLAPFQKQFIRGAFGSGINVACLSVGRGNGKSALSAGIALGELLGAWDDQPRRQVLIAARTRDQARVVWEYCHDLALTLPDDIVKELTFRRSPRLEIEYTGGHTIQAIAADGKGVLGTSPTLAIMDERGHWPLDQGNDLENALLTGLGKRDGKALIISTSAANDAHPFSRWLDEAEPSVYRQEHRPSPALPADEVDSLRLANPGARHGIGFTLDRLKVDAARAIARGGAALNDFRLYNRNERVASETRDVLLTVDQWLETEVTNLPARSGKLIVGIDLGGSASMSGAAFYWPETYRLECFGTFPSLPGLLDRGQADGVSSRYVEMQERGELDTLGVKTVPVADWLQTIFQRLDGEPVTALVADRYKQAEVSEGIAAAGVTCPVIWRGMGFKDGGEDIERFQRAVFDGKVMGRASLLMRSAISDAVCQRDPANNMKLAKARSLGRIDPVAAAVLAVAEGARQVGRPASKGGAAGMGMKRYHRYSNHVIRSRR